ncbi:MAG: hypothetical protein WCH61_01345 [bacterium]
MFCCFWQWFSPGANRHPDGHWERWAQQHQDTCPECQRRALIDADLGGCLKRAAATAAARDAAAAGFQVERIMYRLRGAVAANPGRPPAWHVPSRPRLRWAVAITVALPLLGGGLAWNLAASRQERNRDALAGLTAPLTAATACLRLSGAFADEALARESKRLAGSVAMALNELPAIY